MKKRKPNAKEKLLGGAVALAALPLVLSLNVYKISQKKKYKKRKKKSFFEKLYDCTSNSVENY